MADFNFGEQAGSMENFLNKSAEDARKTAAYGALSKIYGAIAGDPELAIQSASAQTAMANAPLVQAANQAKADALQQSIKDFGPSAGNPEAQQQNIANQDTQATNQRQAQFRALQMLKSKIPAGGDSVSEADYDKIIGGNEKTLGLTDPQQAAAFRARATAPGAAAHFDEIGQALLAPQSAVGAPIVAQGPNGSVLLSRTKNGQIVQQSLGAGIVPVQQQRANQGQQNANTAVGRLSVAQQNANTAAYSANTRSNNSAFGNPNGQAGTRGGAAPAAPAAANTHIANEDGTATTPTFERLAPVGSKARATAIGTANQIVNQDAQLQNTNAVIGQVLSQISPYSAGTGALAKNLPGSIQANVDANLGTIKASGLLAFIQATKAGGPGGTGGLRLATEANAAMNAFGAMEQKQTADQLAYHVKLFQATVNQFHRTAQAAFKAQWGQDPYALLGATPGKGGAGGGTTASANYTYDPKTGQLH